MEKIICSLEDWDSILNYYRPNGSSKTWYLKELKQLHLPLMWANWTLFSEDGDMFELDRFKRTITAPYTDKIEYLTSDKINGRSHIYIINVNDSEFFKKNRQIGFSCISENYLEDVRNGRSAIALFLPYEGYSGTQGNMDFEIIEEWRKQSDLPLGSVYYICGNLLSEKIVKERNLGIEGRGLHYFEPWNKYNEDLVEFKPVDDKNLFLSYNRQPRIHRIRLAIELLRTNLFNRGLLSLYRLNGPLPYALPHENEFLVNNSPFTIDSKYDLYYNLAINITKEDYEKTFISLLTETLVDDGTLFLSEKIWKPIMVGHPFLVYGNKGTLKYLKELGYKTFDKWIDESYDDIDDRELRCCKIVSELSKFSDMSNDELKGIREEMKEVCQHNREHFKKLYDSNYDQHANSTKIENILTEIWDKIKDK
jgi:hypothetical protein